MFEQANLGPVTQYEKDNRGWSYFGAAVAPSVSISLVVLQEFPTNNILLKIRAPPIKHARASNAYIRYCSPTHCAVVNGRPFPCDINAMAIRKLFCQSLRLPGADVVGSQAFRDSNFSVHDTPARSGVVSRHCFYRQLRVAARARRTRYSRASREQSKMQLEKKADQSFPVIDQKVWVSWV